MLMKKSLLAGIVALSALAVFTPAQAGASDFGSPGWDVGNGFQTVGHRNWQGQRHRDHGNWRHRRHLKPWQVRRRLRHRGFYHMHFVDRYAPVYKLRATSPRGHRVFLVVSSRTGRIIDRHRIRRWR